MHEARVEKSCINLNECLIFFNLTLEVELYTVSMILSLQKIRSSYIYFELLCIYFDVVYFLEILEM